MATLDPHEIYLVARHAGFTPDQAVTMTAIALAESSGKTDANLVVGNTEDSWGLWQINMTVHKQSLGALGDPTNPLVNANMAYQVSQGGADIGRWTVTHSDKGARYLEFRQQAQEAARIAEPNANATGNWNPPANYSSGRVGAGDTSFNPTPPELPADLLGSGDTFVDAVTSQAGNVFIDRALAQQGDRYIFGHEVRMDDADPDAFDCSELVQWAAAQAGVSITDGSWLQYQHVTNNGGGMSVDEALRTPGALLFRFGSDPNGGGRPDGAHVAISLGDGRTIEARGRAYGVGVFDAENRNWTHAGVIPELAGATGTLGSPVAVAPPIDHAGDSDEDQILDSFELAIGTNPFNADSDGDGFIDSVELLDYNTDPLDPASNPRANATRGLGIEPTMPRPAIESDFSGYVAPEEAARRAYGTTPPADLPAPPSTGGGTTSTQPDTATAASGAEPSGTGLPPVDESASGDGDGPIGQLDGMLGESDNPASVHGDADDPIEGSTVLDNHDLGGAGGDDG